MVLNKYVALVAALVLGSASTVFAAKREIPVGLASYARVFLLTSPVGEKKLLISGILPMRKNGSLVTEPKNAVVYGMSHVETLLEKADMTWSDLVKVEIFAQNINDIEVIGGTYREFLDSRITNISPMFVCFQSAELPENAVIAIKATAVKNAS